MSWNFKVVSGNRCPRQFEYHPTKRGMVFGTITGEICAIDIYQGESRDNTCEEGGDFEPVPIKSLGYYGKNKNDTMLGLCWLRPQASDIGVDCGSVYGESRGNNNLFLSGSSQGRVCLGNASREYDPTNRNSYSIVHDYPVFDRLTSVHVNCSNKLLLLSGYSPGVNVVDMETSQMVRKYDNIHKDHVNISRFSNLSPHLFATSSFDGTMKTWDLRQSSAGINSGTGLPEYRPVYSVNCNSGVVMINFSQDDNFILASALDNEINQFLFLDGRKHLTYNLPKTGLKSNFTRAYYSASGRHTLTGACEESTVKIMDTYTGEQVSTVELYPGKKDKSIYIQSLRGCPADEDQICVLANYRDMQNRELIMVTRNRRAERAQALDSSLPGVNGGIIGSESSTVEDATRSVAHWFDSSVREGAHVASPEEIDMTVSAMNMTAGAHSPSADAAPDLNAAPEEDSEMRPNNSLMNCYSAQYGEDMRGLCRFCTGLIRGYTLRAASGDGAGETQRHGAQLELYAADGVESRDCTDVVVLMHTDAGRPGQLGSAHGGLFLLPIHAYILEARCPVLYKLYLRQQTESAVADSITSASLCISTDAREGLEIPVVNISAPSAGAPWDAAPGIPQDLLHLLPLLVDYLYTGIKSLDLVTLRYYCLQRFLREDGGKHSLAALLAPFVGEVVRAEIADFAQSTATKKGHGMDVCEADDLNGSGSGIYRANATRSMFLAVQGNAEVELLLKICVDDHCWRQSSVLAVNCVRIGEQLLRLAQSLRLTGLVSVISRILEHSMCPLNAISIYDAAMRYSCAELSEVALRFIASHSGILARQIAMWPEVAAAVAHLSSQHLAQVVMREDFRERKHASERKHAGRRRRSTFDLLMQSLLGSPDLDDDEDEDSAGDNSSEDEDQEAEAAEVDLWQQEEIPFLPAEQERTVQVGAPSASAQEVVHVQRPATVCLPRYISTTMTAMLQDNVLFLGGQNLERLHTYGNRILTYNHSEKVFRHIATGGTHLPKCGYMSCVNALQKSCPTHILVMGAKVKKAESSAHHTSLPQHLRTMRGANDSAWMSMLPASCTGTKGESGAGTSATANGAGRKGWSDLIGMNVDSTGPVSIVQNRLLNIWNFNADREELSPPTAAAYAAEVTAALSSLNTSVDEDGNTVKLPRAQELMKRVGLVFELDCETLTWRSPSVEIEAATRFNAYTVQNAALRMQREDEIEVLHDALRHRFAQAVAPLHQEDVSYRCSECLFSTFPATVCACNTTKADSATDRALEKTWLVQFGGYCEKTESIIADLHVMVCQRKHPQHYGAGADNASGNAFSYKWVKASASGAIPPARFSHTATVIPANPKVSRSCSVRLHSRVLLYGGVGYALNMPALASLRINRSGDATPSKSPAISAEYGHYAHWEVVESSGRAPAPTQGHTLVHLPDSDLCVLCGGAFTGAEGTQNNSCNPDTWILRLVDVVPAANAASPSDTTLRVQWKQLISNGIPPTLRSRHSCFVVPRREGSADDETAEIFIFGGVDEAKLQRRQARHAIVEPDFDKEVKDSVLHTLAISRLVKPHTYPKWLRCSTGVLQDPSEPPIEARISQLLFFQTDTSVQVAECSLSADMMCLLRAAFRLDSAAALPSADASMEADPMEAECDNADEHVDERLQRVIAEFEAHCGSEPVAAARDGAVPVQSTSLTLDLCNQSEVGDSVTTSFGVHESLLRKRCAWFTTLLTSNMRGTQELPGHITLYDVDPVAFRLLLLYVYSDALMICSLHDVVAVLELANQFDLANLARKCEGVLVRLTTLQNVCELLDYSDSLNLTILKASCIALILRDVVEDGKSRGRDYAVVLFAGLPPPESAANEAGSTAGGAELPHGALGLLDALLDPHQTLLGEFQQLSAELRQEIRGIYLRTEQVYAAKAEG